MTKDSMKIFTAYFPDETCYTVLAHNQSEVVELVLAEGDHTAMQVELAGYSIAQELGCLGGKARIITREPMPS